MSNVVSGHNTSPTRPGARPPNVMGRHRTARTPRRSTLRSPSGRECAARSRQATHRSDPSRPGSCRPCSRRRPSSLPAAYPSPPRGAGTMEGTRPRGPGESPIRPVGSSRFPAAARSPRSRAEATLGKPRHSSPRTTGTTRTGAEGIGGSAPGCLPDALVAATSRERRAASRTRGLRLGSGRSCRPASAGRPAS